MLYSILLPPCTAMLGGLFKASISWSLYITDDRNWFSQWSFCFKCHGDSCVVDDDRLLSFLLLIPPSSSSPTATVFLGMSN